MADRDGQRSRVYGWERRAVAPHGGTKVPFARAQGMVDAIWAEMGLRYPPQVVKLPAQARRLLASADRLEIRLPDAVPSWCLLHELAHAMTTTYEGNSDGHGPVFMGVYIDLLTRYLRLTRADLLRSAREACLRVEERARPVFVD